MYWNEMSKRTSNYCIRITTFGKGKIHFIFVNQYLDILNPLSLQQILEKENNKFKRKGQKITLLFLKYDT